MKQLLDLLNFSFMNGVFWSRVFQIVLRSGGIPTPPVEGESKILLGVTFLLSVGNLRRSNFDHSNVSQSYKQLSVNIEHQLKSKLAWPVGTKSTKLKQWHRRNDYSWKWSFFWVIAWKLLFSEGRQKFGGAGGGGSTERGDSRRLSPIPPVGKTLWSVLKINFFKTLWPLFMDGVQLPQG